MDTKTLNNLVSLVSLMIQPTTRFSSGINPYTGTDNIWGSDVVARTASMLEAVDQQAMFLGIQTQAATNVGGNNNFLNQILQAFGQAFGFGGFPGATVANSSGNAQSLELSLVSELKNDFEDYDTNEDGVLNTEELEDAADELEDKYGDTYTDAIDSLIEEMETLSKANKTDNTDGSNKLSKDGEFGLTKKDLRQVKKLLIAENGDFDEVLDKLEEENKEVEMNAITAAQYLADNFDKIGGIYDANTEGCSKGTLENVAASTSDPKLKAAIQWFLTNNTEFAEMENRGHTNDQWTNDGVFTKEDMTKYLRKEAAEQIKNNFSQLGGGALNLNWIKDAKSKTTDKTTLAALDWWIAQHDNGGTNNQFDLMETGGTGQNADDMFALGEIDLYINSQL